LPPPGGLAMSVTSWRSSAMSRLDQGTFGVVHPLAPHYNTLQSLIAEVRHHFARE
jgi:hypothetical protein